ncbi:hypothetical protein WJX72_000009 [[Myrmecia] bisecta]|uniref:Uncharacterized protein n=1 Tax=[Myrmecia] bisecta TaxID=41462 RepID=A0AAW1PTD2_9CHLO
MQYRPAIDVVRTKPSDAECSAHNITKLQKIVNMDSSSEEFQTFKVVKGAWRAANLTRQQALKVLQQSGLYRGQNNRKRSGPVARLSSSTRSSQQA